jgi:hypothetical protein
MEEVERAFFKTVAQGQALRSVGVEGAAGEGAVLDMSAVKGVDVDGLLHKGGHGGEAMEEVELAFFQQVTILELEL